MRCVTIALLVLAAPLWAEDDLAPRLRAALVQLKVTSQSFDDTSPWNKSRARTRTGRGFVVRPGIILTRASTVTDPMMVEFSVANSARLYPARLKHIDPRVGLALVEITDPAMREALEPLPVGEPIKLDDECDIYQLGLDNIVERYNARVVRAFDQGPQLNLKVQTTCADTGNGQVALRDGAVAGLLTSTNRGRQEGTILGVETIKSYLADFEDGAYLGPPATGVWIQPLLREDLRAFAGVSEDQHGVMVTRVMPWSSGAGVMQPRDVMLAIDGFDLDDEGKFVHPVHGRLNAGYITQGRYHPGDTVKVKILRGGQEMEVETKLTTLPESAKRVPRGSGSERPQFMVVGGLVVLELNKRLLRTIRRSPGGVIIRRFDERSEWDPPTERARMVYVDRVLTDPSNKGFENLTQAPIKSVNGQPIHAIADVAKALEKPEGEFHVFRFEGLESDFVIPAAQLADIDKRIAETYKVTLLKNIHGKS
jgi:S1-C subfamily serine protease